MYTISKTFSILAPISSLALGHASHLFAGSDDGSLRVYDLSTDKVVKAIRNLNGEVSSIICVKRTGSELRDAWVAHGSMISKFKLDSSKMIQMLDDALGTISVGETEDDLVNQVCSIPHLELSVRLTWLCRSKLSLNGNKSHLVFGLDSGIIGIIDLTSGSLIKLKQKHESICSSVQFIGDRAKELVSTGYDTSVRHIDFTKDELLSETKMDATLAEGGVSFSPPFIIAAAISPTGVLAVGTADGRLCIFFGGEKHPSKKKSKKWGGLNREEMLALKVAEGPIVALAFSQPNVVAVNAQSGAVVTYEPRILTISTMLGVIMQYELIYDSQANNGRAILKQLWQGNVTSIEKVNTILVDEKRIVVGGLKMDGKGVIEVWSWKQPEQQQEQDSLSGNGSAEQEQG
ncbi:hypothetical protein EST38_g3782 [Candolleomyces aberdarensis]|uniref:Anaphase-promoting complex subunit 4 WD40 domain-containing protein n=1 Tax=Candolleomyces aberdarensis TaxID=2316362 RepID=A0A4Q2DRF4_9AGAR|nr:hypothetical protein EST38_g3782 [Candolleomyces aberdarensis]